MSRANVKRNSVEVLSAKARPSAPLARTDLVDKQTRLRLEEEVEAALRRRPSAEGKLAGALRAVAPLSPALRTSLGEAAAVLLDRGTPQRELCACGLRALAEADDRQAVSLLRRALARDDAGGTAALSAACFSKDVELSSLLAKIAASRQSHMAFGAELARVVRGESNGALLAQLAPMIKESHRISMCTELFVPLLRVKEIPRPVAPALSVLRASERHLGRWLVLAEVAVGAGDMSPLEEARVRADTGPSSSRAAWALVAWALSDADARSRGHVRPAPPGMRPTLELIARLSDRPSADRDTTFLFRMAQAGASATRPMLDGLVRALPVKDEPALRAAACLLSERARSDLRQSVLALATAGRPEELRGMAVAALWDASAWLDGNDKADLRAQAATLADELSASRVVGNVAWATLVRAASKGALGKGPLLGETAFRWIQWGSVE